MVFYERPEELEKVGFALYLKWLQTENQTGGDAYACPAAVRGRVTRPNQPVTVTLGYTPQRSKHRLRRNARGPTDAVIV
ncbi:hypothetical protein E2562_007742 [Oryza meyeriana var. granulata]|uniref:Uncharacterized protein n=1 Tax=Oryza meyeriana var. granulata TaxID=110450 RepID=A0A6G1EGN6_9ORYZ|nr:hypothetical protein E2562_007742 [Oryza meyeriana var. granulata]